MVNRDYRYNPDGVPLQKGSGLTHIFALNHVLSQKTFYEARVTRFTNKYKNYVYEDPTSGVDYLVQVQEDTTVGIAAFDFDPGADGAEANWDIIRDNGLSYNYKVDPDGPMGYVDPDSSAVPTSYSYNNGGMAMGQFDRSTSYWIGKLDLTSQVQRAHQMKVGFETRLHELTLNQYNIREALAPNGTPIEPFEPGIPSSETVNHHVYTRNPFEFSAYIQDKIELKEVNVNIGVRFDYFNANTEVPVNPHDPNIYAPFNAENIKDGLIRRLILVSSSGMPISPPMQERNIRLKSARRLCSKMLKAVMPSARGWALPIPLPIAVSSISHTGTSSRFRIFSGFIPIPISNLPSPAGNGFLEIPV